MGWKSPMADDLRLLSPTHRTKYSGWMGHGAFVGVQSFILLLLAQTVGD
jgi:hypothetical protein